MAELGHISPELAARALIIVMEDISERCWKAGWMDGLEESLWTIMMHQRPDPSGYGMCSWSEINLDLLCGLSDAAGGWVVWHEKGGATFVSFEEWARMHDA